MSRQPVNDEQLHRWLDDELPEATRAEVEAYMAEHPEEAARLAAYRRNDALIRSRFDSILDEPVPARMRRPSQPHMLRRAAMVAWFALGGLAGWYLHDVNRVNAPAPAPPWAHRAVVAHAVYAPEVRHPVEVTAEQEDHLVAWLSKRLGTNLKVPHLDSAGYGLVGGRLLPGEQAAVAQFMYQDGQGQRLTLYVRTNMEQNGESAFRFAQEGNVRVFYWIDRRLGYALSGEISKEDLLRVAMAVHQQLNP
jgi:anti-sigma factor RsiW